MKLILVLFLVFVSFAAGQRDRPVMLCGRQLADARVYLCYGAEYVMKRGGDGNSLMEHFAEGKINEYDSPWKGRHGALSAGWSRYKRDELGLVDQCCLRPCTEDVILSYC